MAIGFGANYFTTLFERGTCRNHEESAAAGRATGLLGVISGGLTGMLLGGDLVGSSMLGAVGGATLGTVALNQLLGPVADAAAAGRRDNSDQFAYQICRLIGASDILKEPLLNRYLEIAERHCAFEREWIARMDNTHWNLLVDCNNGVSEEARQIMLQLIRINQSTCFAIDAVASSLEQMPGDYRGGPRLDDSVDPECDERSPAAVWQSYLRDRM